MYLIMFTKFLHTVISVTRELMTAKIKLTRLLPSNELPSKAMISSIEAKMCRQMVNNTTSSESIQRENVVNSCQHLNFFSLEYDGRYPKKGIER